MRDSGVLAVRRLPRAAGVAGGTAAFTLAVILGLLAGYGWLYVLRGTGWFASGPSVGDSLPLLQLAGSDGQPLLRVAVAWVLAGGLVGLATVRVPSLRRGALAGALGLVLLLLASQGAYALARNLKFSDVLFSRSPGLGPWLEGALFAAGCALPRRFVSRADRRRACRAAASGPVVPRRHRGLGGGQDGDTAQHDADGGQVGQHRDGIRA
jgi:hypothetical protein